MMVYTASEKEWDIEFSYSPLFEMLCSLHVLSKPEHHLERFAWAEEMKNKMSDKLYEKLMDLSKKTYEWCPVMDICNIHEGCNDFNVMAALNFIEDLPIESFIGVFSKYCDPREMKLDKCFINEMTRALKEYYLNYFDRELRFIEPLLVRRLKKDSEVCSNTGIMEYVKGLHNRIEVTEHAFLFHKYTLFTIPFDTLKRVIIRISSFIDPHLLIDYGEKMVQFTIRDHLDRGVEKVPRDLLRLMKALSDETRLRILRIIYRDKASTQSLAQELNISEAGVSKHLKILYDSELLYKERSGSYIYYYLNASLLDMIPMDIYQYLNFN
jgi:DNA-binding transcriptional ArsR family regulator